MPKKGGPGRETPGAAKAAVAARLKILRGARLSEKIFFSENLRVMLRAGLSLSQSFRTLAMQAETKTFRKVIAEIGQGLERGETLTENLAHYPTIFSPIYVNMIRVGELSGTMERSLEELTLQMKKDQAMRSKIKGALTYPVIILAATVVISAGMMIFVVPQILTILSEVQAELPLATRILIAVGTFLQNYGAFAAGGAVAFFALIWLFTRRSAGKWLLHGFFLRLFIVGPIVRKVNLARFTRTLSALLRADVPVADAFRVTADVLGNVHYRHAVLNSVEKIKKGVSIAEAVGSTLLFPPLVGSMITVGESSGTLDEVLAELATFYESQVDEILGNLSQIIEPALILILGVAVGGVAFAVIAPIYSLAENI